MMTAPAGTAEAVGFLITRRRGGSQSSGANIVPPVDAQGILQCLEAEGTALALLLTIR